MFFINRHQRHDQLSSGDSWNFVVVKSDLVWQRRGSLGGSIVFVWSPEPTPAGAARERAWEITDIEWDRKNVSLYTDYYSACRSELPTRNQPNERAVTWEAAFRYSKPASHSEQESLMESSGRAEHLTWPRLLTQRELTLRLNSYLWPSSSIVSDLVIWGGASGIGIFKKGSG